MASLTKELRDAKLQDREDPLRDIRGEFYHPTGKNGKSLVYMNGNSLGLMPIAAERAMQTELDKWKKHAVRGHWTEPAPWLSYDDLARPMLAEIFGAELSEVVAMGTLTANLHNLLLTFYRPTEQRNTLLLAGGGFPSDRYAAESQVAIAQRAEKSARLDVFPQEENGLIDEGKLIDRIRGGKDVHTVLVETTNYITGQHLDIEAICDAAQRSGSYVGLDLAHGGFGNVPLRLHDWGVDFAAWCSYKYGNAGPGSVAGLFVHRDYDNTIKPAMQGWWSNKENTRFAMNDACDLATGADAYPVSNIPIFSTVPLIASLEIYKRAGMERVRARSQELTALLERLSGEHLQGRLTQITPNDPAKRGAQLSFKVLGDAANNHELEETMYTHGLVVDVRPGVLRVAPSPLYNTREDVVKTVRILDKVL
jgi:kynureninase